MQEEIFSITRLNDEIKRLLEHNPTFRNLFVQGEISNYKAHASGHHYMTLKDEGAAINAVLFRSDAIRLRFRLENGMKVIARGRVSSFPKSGQVQLYVSDMMPDGTGALHIAFEQLKRKLYEEGLFELEHKRTLPSLPTVIALITSPTGAAVHDMIRILRRRWPLAKVQVYPALVQGNEAPADLCRALHEVNQQGEADIIIIGRGGGSLEDLWAFNHESVARAVYASKIPIVSAVGHEPDVTIVDYVADLRAPTPSGAAELITPDKNEIQAFLKKTNTALRTGLSHTILIQRQNYKALMRRISLRTPHHIITEKRRMLVQSRERLELRSPKYKIQDKRAELLYNMEKLQNIFLQYIDGKRMYLTENIATLDALSPLRVLLRGYAVALNTQGQTVKDSSTLAPNEEISLRFAQGGAICRIIKIKEEA